MGKVLICDYVHHLLLRGLEELGLQYTYAPEIRNDEVQALLPGLVGIVVNTRTQMRVAQMQAAPQLRFIGRLGIGLDIIDMEEAAARGITVINTPGANANAVAEHTFGMLLGLLHQIAAADRAVRQHLWTRESHRGRELTGLTVGIIGYGNTGSAFASKFANWQTKVLCYDKYKERYIRDSRYQEEVDLDELQRRSDVISLHIPLNDETHYMVDEQFLRRCRKGVVLLNTSRGAILDTKALVTGLSTGRVSAAGLDVLENEKLHTHTEEEKALFDRLCGMKNVIITPHIAGWSDRSKQDIAGSLLAGIRGLYERVASNE